MWRFVVTAMVAAVALAGTACSSNEQAEVTTLDPAAVGNPSAADLPDAESVCAGPSDDRLASIAAEVQSAPFGQLVDRMPLRSWEQYGQGTPKTVRVTSVKPSGAVAWGMLPDGESTAAGNEAMWSGVLVETAPALDFGPIPLALDGGGSGLAERTTTSKLVSDLAELEGACALVIDGDPGGQPLTGAARIIAVASGPTGRPHLLDPQFGLLIDESVPLDRQRF
jgi:hypothetical protein